MRRIVARCGTGMRFAAFTRAMRPSYPIAILAAVLPGMGRAQPAPATANANAACTVTVPAPIRAPQPRWLGDCANGRATGVGVLRVGARTPFGFFFGRVVAGRPQTGLVMLRSGNMMQVRDVAADGTVLPADGEHPAAQDRAWADAAAGARVVAGRMGAAGNASSARYYTRWATRIETQRPE